MFKLILIASILSIVISVKSFAPKKVEANKQIETTIVNKPIALVRYKDTIYHCEGIIKTKCGHSLHCGNMSVHCVTDFQVEYLQ